jgi:multiple antibiotic resistance protein
MWYEFLYAVGISVAAMFPIVNPVGHAPMFFAMTAEDSPGFRRTQAVKTSHAAWGMLNNQSRITLDEHKAAVDKTVALTPMATPILAGPGSMSLAVGMSTYGSTWMNYGGYLFGFVLIELITWVSFLSADSSSLATVLEFTQRWRTWVRRTRRNWHGGPAWTSANCVNG